MADAQALNRLLHALDERLESTGTSLDLYLLGAGALMLQWAVSRAATKDLDVALHPNRAADAETLAEFTQGSRAARALGVYLDIVNPAFAHIPQGFPARAKRVVGPWSYLRMWRLDPHDLVISKLNRFHAGDREDIRRLIESASPSPVDATRLRMVFDTRVDMATSRMSRNLRRVIAFIKGRTRGL